MGCGADAPAKRAQGPRGERSGQRHSYSSAWIYSVGEVDSVGATECKKAYSLIDGERECTGRACQVGRDMARDYLASCSDVDPDHLSQVRELSNVLRERASQPPTSCSDKPNHWIKDGCGTNGACESEVGRWATRCANRIHSPLTVQILERVIENSFSEPHRVKLDIHGCEDFAKELRKVESCDKAFDCQDALPKAEQFLQRCAEGKRLVLSVRDAFGVARVQLGADKEFKAIPVATQTAQVESQPSLPILADNSGLVFKVCDEMTTSVANYVDQRQRCENGEVVLLRAVKRGTGPELDIVRVPHQSDRKFQAAFPSLLVIGENSEREKRGLQSLNQALDALGGATLANGFKAINQAYAALPPSARRSDAARQLFVQHDAGLVAWANELGDAKARIAKTRTNELELIGFMRRTLKFPFSDVTCEGVVQLGSTCDLSELALGQELGASYAAYAGKLEKWADTLAKSKLKGTGGFAAVVAAANQQTKNCTASKKQAAEARASFDSCITGQKPCGDDDPKTFAQLESARSNWRTARAKEIVLKVSAGAEDKLSAECSSF
jgi:hypothetical protein